MNDEKKGMTDNEVELAVMNALAKCGSTEDCHACPLYADANDESCARYVMGFSRRPAAYEIRGGRVVPRTAHWSLPGRFGFDRALFGANLRNERRRAGFTNTKALSAALQEKTGTFVDFDTLLKFERGEREPSASKLVAIAVVLYGRDWPDGLVSLVLGAASGDSE